MLFFLIIPVFLFAMTISVCIHVLSELIREWYITENTSVLLIQAFSTTPALAWDSVSDLIDNFSSKITNVIDTIYQGKGSL